MVLLLLLPFYTAPGAAAGAPPAGDDRRLPDDRAMAYLTSRATAARRPKST